MGATSLRCGACEGVSERLDGVVRPEDPGVRPAIDAPPGGVEQRHPPSVRHQPSQIGRLEVGRELLLVVLEFTIRKFEPITHMLEGERTLAL